MNKYKVYFTLRKVHPCTETHDSHVSEYKVYKIRQGYTLYSEFRSCVKVEVDVLGSRP